MRMGDTSGTVHSSMRPVPSIKGVRFDHNLCSCYRQIAMFAIFVPNFLSSSNLRPRKCRSDQTLFPPPLLWWGEIPVRDEKCWNSQRTAIGRRP